MTPTFSYSFPRSKIHRIEPLIPRTYLEMGRLAGRVIWNWPRPIEAMTWEEIREGAVQGKGHGLYYPEDQIIKINPHMSSLGIYFNFIHENLHYAIPEASDEEINNHLVPVVYRNVTGKDLPKYHDGVTPMEDMGKKAFRLFVLDFQYENPAWNEGSELAEEISQEIIEDLKLEEIDLVNFSIAVDEYVEMFETTGEELSTKKEVEEFWDEVIRSNFEELEA